jgi:hypothetical protein
MISFTINPLGKKRLRRYSSSSELEPADRRLHVLKLVVAALEQDGRQVYECRGCDLLEETIGALRSHPATSALFSEIDHV